MKSLTFLLFCGLLAVSCVWSQEEQQPVIDGYITRAASESDFDVNGMHILCGGKTQSVLHTKTEEGVSSQGCPQSPLYVGEPMRIYGSRNKKEHAVEATRIDALPAPPSEISGSAVIDAPPSRDPADAPATGLLVRADGNRIRIGAKTQIVWAAPLHTLSDVKAGDWIEYKGRRNSNGTVAAASVKLSPDVVSKGEGKLRAKNDFDPSVVPSSARQSTTSMAFIGINPKRFPPYDDPAMQARVTSIGEKLIPDYQRGLPDSDPAKIKFRFQLIDTKMFRDALTLPSGVILVPHQVVERMQNDSQLATVLADNIACALEKQTYRMQPANRAATGAFWGGALVPFAGPVISVGAMASAHDLLVKTEQQSGRVALRLMHDAGYDIDQAPLAWWLLAPKNPKPLLEIQLPDRAAYLYRILGESWHNPAASAQLEK